MKKSKVLKTVRTVITILSICAAAVFLSSKIELAHKTYVQAHADETEAAADENQETESPGVSERFIEGIKNLQDNIQVDGNEGIFAPLFDILGVSPDQTLLHLILHIAFIVITIVLVGKALAFLGKVLPPWLGGILAAAFILSLLILLYRVALAG